MQYEPGVFPIANLENAGQRSQQIKGAKSKHYTNNENMYNMSHGISGYSALAAMFGREDGSRAQGALYDIQNFQNLYQDKLRTIPVTALEQPVGSVTDISGNGNHAYQATAGNRPIVSAKYNQLIVTENLSAPNWQKGVVTVSPDGVITDNFALSATHQVVNAVPVTGLNGVSYTATARVTKLELDWMYFGYYDGVADRAAYVNLLTGAVQGALGGATVTATPVSPGTWDLKAVAVSGGTAFQIVFGGSLDGVSRGYVGVGNRMFQVKRPDLRLTSDAALNIPAYQAVNTATDYDSAGFPRYLKGDGVSQFLQTDAIPFGTALGPEILDDSGWTTFGGALASMDGKRRVVVASDTTPQGWKRIINNLVVGNSYRVTGRSTLTGGDGATKAFIAVQTKAEFAGNVDFTFVATSTTHVLDLYIQNAIAGARAVYDDVSIKQVGTDKMTVIAGVTKLSDAARQIVFECPNVGAGNFAMNAPNGPGLTTIVFATGGSISSAAQPSIGSVPAPVNKVVGATADIAGDNATLYIDGVQVSSVTADMGTGNFSNGPLYIFARDGLSLFSSGRLYGLAICGRAVNPYPLFLAEEEMGSKMGIELS